jgi:cytochrome c oxidase subunit 4
MTTNIHATAVPDASAGGDTHEEGGHRVLPLKLYVGVWAALMVLTWITVAVAQFDFGVLNLWVAMGIATIKASLVVLFFMHVAYDKPINAIVLIISLLFLFLFISFTLIDTYHYHGQLIHEVPKDMKAAMDAASQGR